MPRLTRLVSRLEEILPRALPIIMVINFLLLIVLDPSEAVPFLRYTTPYHAPAWLVSGNLLSFLAGCAYYMVQAYQTREVID